MNRTTSHHITASTQKESVHMNQTTKLLKTIALFIILFVLLLLLINIAYDKLVIAKKLQYKEEQSFQDCKAKNDVHYLFMGDSYTDFAVHPQYIPQSFNLAFPSNTYIENYVKLKKTVEKDNVTPQVLFLEIDPHSFSSYMLERVVTPLRSDPWYYRKYMSLPDLARLSNQSLVKTTILATFPFIGNGEDFLIPKTSSGSYLGWTNRTDDFSLANKTAVAEERIQQQYVGVQRLDPLLIDYYQKTLIFAREHNITVILVRYPQTRTYQETLTAYNISTDPDMQEILAIGRQEGVTTFWDYSNSYLDNASFFENADHLNWKGAVVFSQRLNADLQNSSFFKGNS
jgi:hypothetical protein